MSSQSSLFNINFHGLFTEISRNFNNESSNREDYESRWVIWRKKNWIHEFCYLHITHSFTLYNLLEGSLSLQIYKLLALFVEQVEAIFGLYQL